MYYVDGSKIDKEGVPEGGSAAIMFTWSDEDGDWLEVKRITSKVILDTHDINFMGAMTVTNNTAELQGMGFALRDAARYKGRILIRYDSEYAEKVTRSEEIFPLNFGLVQNVRLYYKTLLQKEDYRFHRDSLDSEMDRNNLIIFEHVQGHSGEVLNDRVDMAAKEAIGQEYKEVYMIDDLHKYGIMEITDIQEIGLEDEVVLAAGAEECKEYEEEEEVSEDKEDNGTESEGDITHERVHGIDIEESQDRGVDLAEVSQDIRVQLANQLRRRRELGEERVRIQRQERREDLNNFAKQLDDSDLSKLRCKVCNIPFKTAQTASASWHRINGHTTSLRHTRAVDKIIDREFGLLTVEEEIRFNDRTIQEELGSGNDELDMRNYPKNVINIDINIEDVEWIEIGSLQALGHAPETRLRPYSLKLREAMLIVIPGIMQSPHNTRLWKRLFLIPIIMASDMRDKKKDIDWKLRKLRDDDWSEFTLAQFKGKYKPQKIMGTERSDKQLKENMEKEFQKNMNRGYLSKAVQVVNRPLNQTRTGQEKFDNLVRNTLLIQIGR